MTDEMPTAAPPAKPIWQSKTFWLHTLTAVVTYAGLASNVLPGPWVPYILGFQSVAGVVLRLVSDQPVTLTGASPNH